MNDMVDWKVPEGIPTCFYNEREGGKHPTATTVGKLIKELQRLPPNLKVKRDSDLGVKLIVFNAGWKSRHLGFESRDF
jgi:hypothetical protein